MDYYAGFDASLELSSVCILDGTGQIIRHSSLIPGILVMPIERRLCTSG